MFLHSLFFPNYLPLSDFSCLEPYQFSLDTVHESSREISFLEELNEEKPIEIKIKIEKEKEPEKPQEKKVSESESESNSLFHVKNVQDELFWLVFVAIYGETEYYRNKYNYGKVEIQEKQKIAEKILDPEFGKKMKWKWTKIQRIEMISDLTNRPQMPIAIMNALAAYYECTFILVDPVKKVYLNYGSSIAAEEKEKTYIIYVSSKIGSGKVKKEYKLDMQPSLDTLQKIQDEMFALEHYERPLKAISNYKKIELDVLATKIGVLSGGRGTSASKNEVYDRLRLHLSDSAILFLQE
jgi:hypothetical protein